jgi:RNA polymerase sigma-70 factor (ECF subfamily)
VSARSKVAADVPAARELAADGSEIERGPESRHLDRCMERFLDGDRAAFEELYRRLAPRLLRSLRLSTGDPQLADDLLQITFLKVVSARESYRRGMSAEAWIWAIAKHSRHDEQRRSARARELVSALPICTPEVVAAPDHDDAEALSCALRELPEAQREALLLLKVYDLPASEAASAAGTTVGAVKMRAQRAFETLRKLLVPGGGR